MGEILKARSVKLRDGEGKVIAPRTKASVVEMDDGMDVQDTIAALIEKINELEGQLAELNEANLLELNVPDQE